MHEHFEGNRPTGGTVRVAASVPVVAEFTDAGSTQLVELWADGVWTAKSRADRFSTWSAPVVLQAHLPEAVAS